jgi:hypothetical protein
MPTRARWLLRQQNWMRRSSAPCWGVDQEARGIWAELQQRDWVNPDLDLDWIMEKLAHNWDHWELLARDRDTDTSPVGVRLITGPRPDQDLVERLRDLARAPYEAMPWPDPPNVDLGRLVDDYERTTGHHLEFTWEWEAYPHAGFWSVMVSIDGGVVGGWGEGLHDDPEADLVALTDRLQSEQLGEEFDGDWPKCPHHRNIVMLPKNEGGTAMWTCQADSAHRVPIGNLGLDAF